MSRLFFFFLFLLPGFYVVRDILESYKIHLVKNLTFNQKIYTIQVFYMEIEIVARKVPCKLFKH